MRRMVRATLLSLLLLALPATAQAPSVDELARAYQLAPWFAVEEQGSAERFVCIAHAHSQAVDRVVRLLVQRAKATCS